MDLNSQLIIQIKTPLMSYPTTPIYQDDGSIWGLKRLLFGQEEAYLSYSSSTNCSSARFGLIVLFFFTMTKFNTYCYFDNEYCLNFMEMIHKIAHNVSIELSVDETFHGISHKHLLTLGISWRRRRLLHWRYDWICHPLLFGICDLCIRSCSLQAYSPQNKPQHTKSKSIYSIDSRRHSLVLHQYSGNFFPPQSGILSVASYVGKMRRRCKTLNLSSITQPVHLVVRRAMRRRGLWY